MNRGYCMASGDLAILMNFFISVVTLTVYWSNTNLGIRSAGKVFLVTFFIIALLQIVLAKGGSD